MYLRTTKRRNKDGSTVCYYALAENVRHPEKGYVEAKDLGLYQLYRAMDILAEHGDAIEEEVFWNSADLFKLPESSVLG